mgnify:CR=1 FL=1
MAATAFEQVTVSTTVQTLTSAPYSGIGDRIVAHLRVDGVPVRFRIDGTAPTASIGELWFPGEHLTLHNQSELDNFKVISTSTTSATVTAHYVRG